MQHHASGVKKHRISAQRGMRLRAPLLALSAALGALAVAGSGPAGALLDPPPPCLGVAQITDPTGDGHHPPTDVTSAWFSEDAGHLQAVIKVNSMQPEPQHDDADENGAGLVMLFTVGGAVKYVRATIPFATDGPPVYDYGTYPSTETFASAGSTTGEVFTSVTGGSVIIDVPAATGAVDDALLDDPWAYTYDGIVGGDPTDVDHAPGGTSPTDSARGADYVVGSCGDDPGTTVAVQLFAPTKLKGGGKNALVTGNVLPARGDVPVVLTRQAFQTTVTNLLTEDDGTFAVSIPVHETTRLKAVAETISSQTVTVTVQSTVRIALRRLAGGKARITGKVGPSLPGRLLLLRTNAFKPAQTTRKIKNGKFSFLLKRPKAGGYQVVYIPSNGRALRSTSNTVRFKKVKT
jgi:hypothetical protein